MCANYSQPATDTEGKNEYIILYNASIYNVLYVRIYMISIESAISGDIPYHREHEKHVRKLPKPGQTGSHRMENRRRLP